MSSLYKRTNGSPYYWWSSVHDGVRLFSSTKMTNKKLARKIAEKWDFNLMMGDLSFLGKSKYPTKLTRHYLRDYLVFIGSRKDEKAVYTAKGILNKFVDYLDSQSIHNLDEITLRSVDGYLDSLTKKVKVDKNNYEEVTVAPKTKKNHLQEVSLMLKQAVKENLIDKNPANEATLPKMVAVTEHRVLYPIDLDIIFNGAGGYTLFYSFLYHTGLRAGDIQMLKYGNIDFKKKLLISLVRKSGKTQVFPISEVLLHIIPRNKNPEEPVFPELYVENDWRRAKDKLAKPRKFMQALLNAQGRPKDADLHSFRHTFNTKLRDLGLRIEDRQVLMSHSAGRTNKMYTHPNEELAREYVNQIESYIPAN